jgi:hypothetical protein
MSELKGLTDSSYFRARKELLSKGWIVAKKDFISPVVCFETLKNESHTLKNESASLKNGSYIYKDNTNPFTNPLDRNRNGAAIPESKFARPFESLSKSPVDEAAAAATLNHWLDQIALTVGASSRHTMAQRDKWEKVCIKAIEDGKSVEELIAVTKAEKIRLANQPQFFSPDNILKQLQIVSANLGHAKACPRTDEEKRADFEKQNYSDRRIPEIKI